MKWSDEYKIGISAVDSQHKRLFELVQELNEVLQKGLKGADVESLLVVLDQYKTRHFQLEEKYMEECDYPAIAEQRKAHESFTDKFEELRVELNEQGLTPNLINSIRGELALWLKDHVTGLDMQFGEYYQTHKKAE